MWYSVEVDLSAKAETWTLASAIAVANGEQWVLFVPSKVKQQLRTVLTSRYGTKNLQYRAFALFVYVALRPHLQSIEHVVIDQDYEGAAAESTIKNFLLYQVRRDRPEVSGEFVRFANVKGGRADRLAKRVFDGKERATRAVRYEEFEDLL